MADECLAPLFQGDGRDAVGVLSQIERQSIYCNNWIGVRVSSDAGEVLDDPIGIAAASQHGGATFGKIPSLSQIHHC